MAEGAAWPGESTVRPKESGWFREAALSVEINSAADATAFGARIVQPFRMSEKTALLVDIFGAKGDADFGILSGGVALRRAVGAAGMVVGVNAFYDVLRDADGFLYSQLGFGGEISRGRWTARANGFFPVGDSHSEDREQRELSSERTTFSQNAQGQRIASQVTTTRTETTTLGRDAAWGWEAELEYAIPAGPAWLDPRVAVGYYQIEADHASASYSGFKARGEVRFGEHLAADVEWRQDGGDLQQEWRAGLRFQFLLGKPSKSEKAATLARRAARRHAGDGKVWVDLEGDGKSIKPLADGKGARPFDGGDPWAADYPGLYTPVRRTPWPYVLSSRRVDLSKPRTGRTDRIISSNPSPPPDGCQCQSGDPLIFD